MGPRMSGRRSAKEADEDEEEWRDLDSTRHALKRLLSNKFALIGRHLEELDTPATPGIARAKRRRLERTLRHAQSVLALRLVITVFLVLAAGSAAFTAFIGYLDVIPGAVDVVTRLIAYTAGSTLVLLLARFVCDRYLDIVHTMATLLAIEIAAAGAAKA